MRNGDTELLRAAGAADLDILLPLVADYHRFEGLELTDRQRRAALAPLLAPASALGLIWLVCEDERAVGYVAVCYGYSIEFAGRDAFIDEFFLLPEARGRGLGRMALARVQEAMRAQGIVALHLEVQRDNARARRLYRRSGFRARDRYHLMTWSAAAPAQAADPARH